MKPVAVIDVGSNAIRMNVAKRSGSGFAILHKVREPIRLGADVFEYGYIQNSLVEKTLKAFKKFKKVSQEFSCEKVIAVGTSALRNSKNNQEIISQVEALTGIEIELISGTKEASYAFQAINYKVNLSRGQHLLMDIGGGSVELIQVNEGEVLDSKSFPLGTVRILKKLQDDKTLLRENNKADINLKIAEALQPIAHFTQKLEIKSQQLVGIGGNFERMLKVHALINEQESPKHIERDALQQIFDVTSAMTLGQRNRLLKLKQDQADVIIPALIATLIVMESSGAQSLQVPKVGIKDRLILNHFGLI